MSNNIHAIWSDLARIPPTGVLELVLYGQDLSVRTGCNHMNSESAGSIENEPTHPLNHEISFQDREGPPPTPASRGILSPVATIPDIEASPDTRNRILQIFAKKKLEST